MESASQICVFQQETYRFGARKNLEVHMDVKFCPGKFYETRNLVTLLLDHQCVKLPAIGAQFILAEDMNGYGKTVNWMGFKHPLYSM